MSRNNPNTREQRREQSRTGWSSGRGRGGGEGGRGDKTDLTYERGGSPFGDERQGPYFGDANARGEGGRDYGWPSPAEQHSDEGWRTHEHPRFGEATWRSDPRYAGEQRYAEWSRHEDPYGERDQRRFGPRDGYGPPSDRRYGGQDQSGFDPHYPGERTGWHSTTERQVSQEYRPGRSDEYGTHRAHGAPVRGYATGNAQQGLHSGRGPKGYTRSDERIREDVCDALTWDPDLDASEMTVSVSNGEVTLSGVVEDRQAKRQAEEVIEDIAGLKDVHNQLRARRGFFASMRDEVLGREERDEESNVGKGPKGSMTNPSAQYRS